MHRSSDYDRILISLAVAVLGAAVLTRTAKAQELDRYGGEMRPVLNWSGKTYAATPAPSARPAAWAAPQPASPTQAYAPPPMSALPAAPPHEPMMASRRRDRRAFASARPAPQPTRPAPTSIYAPAPVSPPVRTAAAPSVYPAAPAPPSAAPAAYGQSSVRRYSVHRDFGMRPDPTPIPPQFFTATADLSAADSAEATPLPRTPPAQTGVKGRIVTPTTADPS